MTMKTLTLLTVIISTLSLVSGVGLNEEFSWTRITYDWPDSNLMSRSSYGTKSPHAGSRPSDIISFPGETNVNQEAIRKEPPADADYTYENNIPMGANAWRNKVFITVPRRRSGIPSSLNFIWADSSPRHNVPLIPYPDWETNTLTGNPGRDGHKFVSVYRVAVDECDRLWFVDTGRMELPDGPRRIQPAALVVMDLKTDTIMRYHVINNSSQLPNSAMALITVDVTNKNCNDAFAYIPDLSGYGLIVYSFKGDRDWRVTHNYFFLEPNAGEFRIGGHDFQWNDGIFSIALSAPKSNGYRDAYFHSMAGLNLYKVSTRILRNERLSSRSYHGNDFQIVGHKGDLTQSSASALYGPRGILFMGLVNQNALGCWNVNTPITDLSVVQKDDATMIYPSDVKISGNDVIVLTNKMPVFLYGHLNYDQTNFRVWRENVDKAVKGTKCDVGRRQPTKGGRGRYY